MEESKGEPNEHSRFIADFSNEDRFSNNLIEHTRMHVHLVGGPQGGYNCFYSKVVKMDASWFIEFVSFVRENWQWCAAAIVMLLCLHHFMGNSDDKQAGSNELSSRSNSTGNSCTTTVNPVINVVPDYSVSDRNLRSELNQSDRRYFDTVYYNSQKFIDYGANCAYGNPASAMELKAKASALQESVAIKDVSCLKGRSFDQCIAAYRMSVVVANSLHRARVELQQTCSTIPKESRKQPSYKNLVELEKDLYNREQNQNRMSGLIRDFVGSSFGNRGKRWHEENRKRMINNKARAK